MYMFVLLCDKALFYFTEKTHAFFSDLALKVRKKNSKNRQNEHDLKETDGGNLVKVSNSIELLKLTFFHEICLNSMPLRTIVINLLLHIFNTSLSLM